MYKTQPTEDGHAERNRNTDVTTKLELILVNQLILIVKSPYGTSCDIFTWPAVALAETKHTNHCRSLTQPLSTISLWGGSVV